MSFGASVGTSVTSSDPIAVTAALLTSLSVCARLSTSSSELNCHGLQCAGSRIPSCGGKGDMKSASSYDCANGANMFETGMLGVGICLDFDGWTVLLVVTFSFAGFALNEVFRAASSFDLFFDL